MKDSNESMFVTLGGVRSVAYKSVYISRLINISTNVCNCRVVQSLACVHHNLQNTSFVDT